MTRPEVPISELDPLSRVDLAVRILWGHKLLAANRMLSEEVLNEGRHYDGTNGFDERNTIETLKGLEMMAREFIPDIGKKGRPLRGVARRSIRTFLASSGNPDIGVLARAWDEGLRDGLFTQATGPMLGITFDEITFLADGQRELEQRVGEEANISGIVRHYKTHGALPPLPQAA